MNSHTLFNNQIIEIYELKEFLRHAKNAPLVIYDPVFFSSPFLDEHKIQCVTCYAIGVKFHKLPVTLKFQNTWKNINHLREKKHENPKSVIDTAMRTFINQLITQFNAIKGTVHGEKAKSIWHEYF